MTSRKNRRWLQRPEADRQDPAAPWRRLPVSIPQRRLLEGLGLDLETTIVRDRGHAADLLDEILEQRSKRRRKRKPKRKSKP